MRILSSEQVHFQPTDMRFGPSKIKSIVAFIAVAAFFSILIVVTSKDRAWGALIIVSILCGIFLLITGSFAVKAFSKNGWRVVLQNSVILLKADTIGKHRQDIIEIQFREIASVRKLREQYLVYKKGKKRTHLSQIRMDALDFDLNPDAYAQLTSLTGSAITGLDLSTPNRLIYPTGTHMLSTPNIITQLEKYCRVEEDHAIEYEKPNMDNAQQINDYILLLVRRGRKMDSQQLARKAFGLGLSESKQYVADLLQKAS